jgi:DNA-binding beta-propeller fold protein YncE
MTPIRSILALTCALALSVAAPTARSATRGTERGDGPQSARELWRSMVQKGDTPFDVAVSPDGTRAYVTGCSGLLACSTGWMTTVAYEVATGTPLWMAQHPQRGGVAIGVAVAPDGQRVYVTGYVTFANHPNYVTIAYDAATGAQVWEARYNGGDTDVARRVAASPDGTKVLVTGESWSDRTYFDFLTVAYDAATGAQLWVARYDGMKGYDDPHGLGVSPDGSLVFVTGESPGTNGNDFATVAYDAAIGSEVWASRYNDPSKRADTPYDLAVAPDGSAVYVTGCAGIGDDCINPDFLTVAYEAATGGLDWAAIRQSPADDAAVSVGVSPDGTQVYVTGSVEQQDDYDFATVAYDAATGSQVWRSVYASARDMDDYACCLAVGGNPPRVVVTGSTSVEYGFTAFSTVEYDGTTGAQLWLQRFSAHPAVNYPKAIALTQDGNVAFVTGLVAGPGGYDWMTIAYRA